MIYDLSNLLHRKQFVARCNKLLSKRTGTIVLKDESQRTLQQNRYLHVLIRILAIETGVTEEYSKQVYFKKLANPNLFVTTEKNPITGEVVETLKSSSELSTEEMSIAINTFRHWSEEHGYYLPEANPEDQDKSEYEFASDDDEKAFRQAEIETGRLEHYLNG